MAVRELMIATMLLAMGAAQSNSQEDESRFIVTSAGSDNNLAQVTIGMNTIILVSLTLVGILIAVVLSTRLNDEGKEQPAYHSAPSSYSSDAAHEKSYTIQRFIENAAARYL